MTGPQLEDQLQRILDVIKDQERRASAGFPPKSDDLTPVDLIKHLTQALLEYISTRSAE